MVLIRNTLHCRWATVSISTIVLEAGGDSTKFCWSSERLQE